MNKKILFTDDVFRISANIEFQLDSWLFSIYKMFSEQINIATGQYPILSLARDNTFFDVKKFYDLCNYEYNETNWLRISSGEITPEAEEYFKSSFENYFMIVYHANPLMIELFNKYGIEYIDIFEGSVRFLEDIHLVMRSNNVEIYKKLLQYKYEESSIKIEAGRCCAYYKNYGINLCNLKDNSLLICGQTGSDISLLRNGKYVTFQDFQEKIAEIVKNYDYLYFKPHPYCHSNEEYIRLFEQFKSFEVLYNTNFYGLMASEKIHGVAALSSGVLKEAQYFNKNVHVLSHLYVNYHIDESDINIKNFVILKNDYYSPTFWSDVLSPVFETRRCTYFNFNNNSNWLRNNVFSWWGYEINNGKPVSNSKPILNSVSVESVKPINEEFSTSCITSEDISVVVQGPVADKKQTAKSLKSVRKYLPKAEIVLSTWNDADVTGLDYDVLVLNEDPGSVDLMPITEKKNNVNRQIISTQNGLNKANRKYALKIRTDAEIVNLGFLKTFNNLLRQPLKREKSYNYFKNRIIIDSCFTKNPGNINKSRQALCFHPSNICLFGYCEDLKSLFDIPLQTKFIVEVNNKQYQYRVPEQYIWTKFLEKNGVYNPMDTMYYNDKYTRELSNRTILNNFFVLNHSLIGIKLPKKIKTCPKTIFESIMSTYDYLVLYQMMYDPDYKIPIQYKNSITDVLGIGKYLNKLKALLQPFKIIYEIPLLIFKILSKILLNGYKILGWLK